MKQKLFKRKLFAFLLMFAMIFSSMPLSAFAADDGTITGKEKPAFEPLALVDYNLDYSPDKLEYDVALKSNSSTSISIDYATKYDTDKYEAVAECVDLHGDKIESKVYSEKSETIHCYFQFGQSVMNIVIFEKANPGNKTVYKLNITRLRDDNN